MSVRQFHCCTHAKFFHYTGRCCELLVPRSVLLFMGVFSIASVFSPAYSDDLCPEFIEVMSEVVSEYPGWQLGLDTKTKNHKHRLERIGFSRGAPADEFILHPDVVLTDDRSGLRTAMYNFEQQAAENEQKSIWLICEYTETRETLTKPISVTACTVTDSEQNQDVVLECE